MAFFTLTISWSHSIFHGRTAATIGQPNAELGSAALESFRVKFFSVIGFDPIGNTADRPCQANLALQQPSFLGQGIGSKERKTGLRQAGRDAGSGPPD
jgi:hypothetical protein